MFSILVLLELLILLVLLLMLLLSAAPYSDWVTQGLGHADERARAEQQNRQTDQMKTHAIEYVSKLTAHK